VPIADFDTLYLEQPLIPAGGAAVEAFDGQEADRRQIMRCAFQRGCKVVIRPFGKACS
jgi:hypothetical protein